MPADSQTADLARRVRELELERRIRSLVESEARKSEQRRAAEIEKLEKKMEHLDQWEQSEKKTKTPVSSRYSR